MDFEIEDFEFDKVDNRSHGYDRNLEPPSFQASSRDEFKGRDNQLSTDHASSRGKSRNDHGRQRKSRNEFEMDTDISDFDEDGEPVRFKERNRHRHDVSRYSNSEVLYDTHHDDIPSLEETRPAAIFEDAKIKRNGFMQEVNNGAHKQNRVNVGKSGRSDPDDRPLTSEEELQLIKEWRGKAFVDWENLPPRFPTVPWSIHWPMTRFHIERNRKSYAKKIAAVYTLYAGDFEETRGQPLLYAKRVISLGTSHYVISSNKADLSCTRDFRTDGYLGKLRSNSNTTQYSLYDHGLSCDEYEIREFAEAIWNASKTEDDESQYEIDPDSHFIRHCLASVVYKKAKEGKDRRMEVALPAVNKDGELIVWEDEKVKEINKEPLIDAFLRARNDGSQNVFMSQQMMCFQVFDARFDKKELQSSEDLSELNHPSSKPSTKNFQLIYSVPSDVTLHSHYSKDMTMKFPKKRPSRKSSDKVGSICSQDICLQMSKISNNMFNVDLAHPFSLLQAFSICLSRMDTKYG